MAPILPPIIALAQQHMDHDRAIIHAPIEKPLLRWYDWEAPCVTVGLFSNMFVPHTSCEVARRPTGGAILFHGNDLAGSLFFPKYHKLYPCDLEQVCHYCNTLILDGLGAWLPQRQEVSIIYSASPWCMAAISSLDLVWNGKKIGGGAFRRTRYGALYQMSLFIESICWDWIALMGGSASAMQETSTSLEEMIHKPVSREDVRSAIEASFIRREYGYV